MKLINTDLLSVIINSGADTLIAYSNNGGNDRTMLEHNLTDAILTGVSSWGVIEFDVCHQPAGVYFCQTQVNGIFETKKMVILK